MPFPARGWTPARRSGRKFVLQGIADAAKRRQGRRAREKGSWGGKGRAKGQRMGEDEVKIEGFLLLLVEWREEELERRGKRKRNKKEKEKKQRKK